MLLLVIVALLRLNHTPNSLGIGRCLPPDSTAPKLRHTAVSHPNNIPQLDCPLYCFATFND